MRQLVTSSDGVMRYMASMVGRGSRRLVMSSTTGEKNQKVMEESTFELATWICSTGIKLTCDSLRHNVCHFTAWWDHSHAELVHHQNLRENSTLYIIHEQHTCDHATKLQQPGFKDKCNTACCVLNVGCRHGMLLCQFNSS